MKKVSIVIAAFRGELMDRVFESINKQTYKDFEIIIVCDDSNSVRFWWKDKKAKEDIPDNICFIDIGKNQGNWGLQARNIGAMCASFDRIAFLDDDCEWETETYLENMLKAEEETGKIPYSNLRIRGKRPGSTHDVIKHTFLRSNKIDLGNPLYRKEFFKKYGYFDNSKNRIGFDWDYIQKIKEGEGEDAFVWVDENYIFWHHRY